jgi:GT2 family glycosyltransferase
MSHPSVGIIILNWNGKEVLRTCLNSIQKNNYPNYYPIVVDNGSNDGSQQMIKNDFPEAILVENEVNKGVAEGQNIGIKKALAMGTDYIFILNNDVILHPDVITNLLNAYKIDGVGISLPIMYSYENQNEIQSSGGIINWARGRGDHPIRESLDLNEIIEVDYLGLIFTSTEIVKKVGLFNPDYFAYWEDAEYCLRVKNEGYKVVSVPSAKVLHFGSHDVNKITGFKSYYSTRNMFWFMKTYAKKQDYITFLIYYFGLRFWLMNFQYLRNKSFENMSFYFRGIIDGMKYNLNKKTNKTPYHNEI